MKSEANPRPGRGTWTALPPEQLLAQCEVDTYRASGPGGQKRNKTSSAVRLRHTPSGIIVIAEESRSQHENKARALRRLYRELYLQWRDPAPADPRADPAVQAAKTPDGRFHLSSKDARFWPAVGVVLDVLHECDAQISTAAQKLGTSTANLVDFLRTDHKVWQAANQLRTSHGQGPLRA